MCKFCKYGRGCCDECYLNRKTHVVFYNCSYRKSDFLCKACIKFYYDRKCREMLGIQEIV